jgi:hypothetical protein
MKNLKMSTMNFTDCEGKLIKYSNREIDGMRHEVCSVGETSNL